MLRSATTRALQWALLAPGRVGLLLALLLLGGAATAQDRIGARAFWEEPACTAVPLADVRPEAFTPYSGLLARNYSRCGLWVRLRIDPPSAGVQVPSALPQDTLVLRIRPTYLDRVEIFDPAHSSSPLAVTGDLTLAGPREYPALGLHALLPAADTPREIYLRLQTTSTRMLELQVLPLAQALQRDRLEELATTTYLGVLAVALLGALVHWLRTRERVLGAFVVKQALCIGWSMALLGYGRALLGPVLPPAWIDGGTSVLVLTYVAASLFFDHELLREYRPPRWGLWLLRGFIALLPLQLLMLATGHASLALQLNSTAAGLAVVAVLAIILCARPGQGDAAPVLPRGLLAVFYGLICGVVGFGMLVQLGLMATRGVGQYAMFMHGLLTGVVMLLFLATRSYRLSRRHAQAVQELALTRERAAQEQRHREDQEKLLGMLTHELKTPLSVMRMLLGTGRPDAQQVAQLQRALADMTDVVERCAQADLLAGDRLQALHQPFNLRIELETLAEQWRGPDPLVLELDESVRQRALAAPMLQTDPQLLHIVLLNLLDNARKYGQPGSAITVRLALGANAGRAGLAVEVSNLPGSAGWPDPQRLFQKYYRSPAAHRQTGSGLGLYLVAGLVHLLGGHVSYQPTQTHVRFRLWLPA